MHVGVNRTPHTPKNSPSVNDRTVGDSTWMIPLVSWVWREHQHHLRAGGDPELCRNDLFRAVHVQVEVLVDVEGGAFRRQRGQADADSRAAGARRSCLAWSLRSAFAAGPSVAVPGASEARPGTVRVTPFRFAIDTSHPTTGTGNCPPDGC
jgi:hypothetical protein